MAFNIGDRVRAKVGNHRCTGFKGEVLDIIYSTAKKEYTYRVRFDDFDDCKADFTEEDLELIQEETVTYHFETDIAEDNVVIVIMYEDYEDGSSKEIGRGHGHIIHEGAYGIAQAASYGMFKMYNRMAENNL